MACPCGEHAHRETVKHEFCARADLPPVSQFHVIAAGSAGGGLSAPHTPRGYLIQDEGGLVYKSPHCIIRDDAARAPSDWPR